MSKDKFNTAEEEETTKKSQVGNAIGGFLAMLPTIAGAVPGLRKSKQTGELEAMQQGRGAGAMAARQAGSEAGRRTAGNVGGRGSSGQVRAGLRSAEAMAAQGAQTAGIIGAREGMFATQLLMGDEQRRRNLGLQLGAGIGGATAAGLATGLAGADQGPETPGQEAGAPGGDVQGALAQMVAPPPTELTNPITAFQRQPEDFTPSLYSGAPGTAEGFGSLTYDQGLETLGGRSVATGSDVDAPPPNAQLQEPTPGSNIDQAGLVLPSLANPQQGMEQAVNSYRQSVLSKETQPLTSPGGSDDVAFKSIYEQRVAQALDEGRIDEKTATDAMNYYNVTGQPYSLVPEESLSPLKATTGSGTR
jgi:hypothetical protein